MSCSVNLALGRVCFGVKLTLGSISKALMTEDVKKLQKGTDFVSWGYLEPYDRIVTKFLKHIFFFE